MNKKFYIFDQWNSGGYYVKDDKVGEYVIIHASSAQEANDIAEDLGIYFDGIRKKIDCECCNDRWYRVSECDGREKIKLDERMKERGYKIYADEEWKI